MNRSLVPAIYTPSHLPIIDMKRGMLKNEIPVYYLDNQEDLLRVSLFFETGTLQEKRKGIASALSQLLLSGTSNLNAFEVQEQLDLWGAYTEIDNGYEGSVIHIYCLKPHAKSILEFITHVLLDVVIPEQEFLLYQERSMENLKVNLQKTSFLAKKRLAANMFGQGHPYGRTMDHKNFQELTLAEIQDFYRSSFINSLERVVLNTPVNPDILEPLSLFPRGTTKKQRIASSDKAIETRVNLQKADAVQASLAMGMECIGRRSEDYPAWALLITLFGGYFGSRLMKNIREDKGYTYGIHAGIQHLPDRSYLSIRSDVKNNAKEACIEEIFLEIKRLKEETIAEEEITVVKNYLLGSVQRSFDGSIALCDRFRNLYDNHLPDDFYQNYIKKIKEADAKLLKDLANKYLDTSQIYVVVAGNFST